jgi:predicted cobalt transporter CbtA
VHEVSILFAILLTVGAATRSEWLLLYGFGRFCLLPHAPTLPPELPCLAAAK